MKVAFGGQSQIRQNIATGLAELAVLLRLVLGSSKKPTENFNLFHVFQIQPSIRYEKQRQILETIFVVLTLETRSLLSTQYFELNTLKGLCVLILTEQDVSRHRNGLSFNQVSFCCISDQNPFTKNFLMCVQDQYFKSKSPIVEIIKPMQSPFWQ